MISFHSIPYELISLLHTSHKYFLLCIFSISFNLVDITPSFAAAGDLDTSFGTSGIVMTSVSSGNDIAQSVAVQPDGKILLTGYLDTGGTGGSVDFAVVRYNVDGSLDAGFGVNGIVTIDIGEVSGDAYAVVVQPDGKVLLGGDIWNPYDYNSYFALVRYDSNGALDTTLDGDGIAVTTIDPNLSFHDDNGFTLALQADSKILLSGTTYSPTGFQTAIVRYNTNGSLDTTFGTNGIVTINIGPYLPSWQSGSMALQPDGKIVLNGPNTIARCNEDGSLDTAFGVSGIVTSANDIQSVALQSDGKILAAGEDGIGAIAVERYDSSGNLDVSFDGDGVQTIDVDPVSEFVRSVVVQPDGKILLGGADSSGKHVLIRVNTNGTLDTTFGGDGIVVANVVAIGMLTMALQADGKILMGGYAFESFYVDFQLARYLNDDSGLLAQLTPTSFTFTDSVDVELSSVQTSNTVTVSGLGAGITVPVTVDGGEYAINGGSYTSSIGYVANGDQISVSHTSADTGATDVNTTLSVGGLHTKNNLAVFLGAQASDIFTTTTTGQIDTDSDGVPDSSDNCTEVMNPDQRDTDGDLYGNICDPDFDNNGVVQAADLAYLKSKFFTADEHADLDGNGVVQAADLAILKAMFFGPPGPSGLVP